MIFKKISYRKFTFKINQPLENSQNSIKKKDIIIIKAIDELNNIHYGEVSPLPGISNECIDECELKIKSIIKNKVLENNLDINEIRKHIYKYPSLLYGIEQLFYTNDAKHKILNINAVIGIHDNDYVLEKIKYYLSCGFKVIKLKIGRNSFEDDLKLLDQIYNNIRDDVLLRLDANSKWKYEEALLNLQKMKRFNIEYVEDPVLNKIELKEIAQECFSSVAPDESIKSYEEAVDLVLSKNINFIILKPTLHLGVFDSLKIIEFANKRKVNVIITSAFETVIGRSTLFSLASHCDHSKAHGLNTELLGLNNNSKIIKLDFPTINLGFLKSNYSEDITF